ncbi:MAG: AraC family transcriptional regulator [Clostridiales bacterium]|nr:AraC family transcriptional regulator [Clostridiales bacterium]
MEKQKTRYHFIKDYDDPLRFGEFYLVQIGRRFCECGEIIPTHAHQTWFELTIVTKGSGIIVTNGKETEVKTGDIYLSYPCDLHELKAPNDRLEYDFFAFYTTEEPFVSELSALSQTYLREDMRVFRDEKINFLVANAILEFSVDKAHAKTLLTNIFQQILVYLLRDFNNRNIDTADVSSADILCFQLMNYIDTHIYEIEQLERISPLFNYNYSYLSTLFKRTTGKTISEYYNHRRLETAKALIGEKKKKIGEIADILHYASPFSLSKAFKVKYGVSPKNLQKQL